MYTVTCHNYLEKICILLYHNSVYNCMCTICTFH